MIDFFSAFVVCFFRQLDRSNARATMAAQSAALVDYGDKANDYKDMKWSAGTLQRYRSTNKHIKAFVDAELAREAPSSCAADCARVRFDDKGMPDPSTLSMAVIEAYVSWVIDGNVTKKRKRGGHGDGKEKARLTSSHAQGCLSAVKHLFEVSDVQLPTGYERRARDLMKGFNRDEALKRRDGTMPTMIGKVSL